MGPRSLRSRSQVLDVSEVFPHGETAEICSAAIDRVRGTVIGSRVAETVSAASGVRMGALGPSRSSAFALKSPAAAVGDAR